MRPTTYNYTLITTPDMPHETLEMAEDAEDSRAFPLSHIEAECRRLGVTARLETSERGFVGVMDDEGNVVFV